MLIVSRQLIHLSLIIFFNEESNFLAENGKEGVGLSEDADSSDSGGEVEQEEGKQSAEKQYAAYDDSDEVGLEKSDSDSEEKETQQKDG